MRTNRLGSGSHSGEADADSGPPASQVDCLAVCPLPSRGTRAAAPRGQARRLQLCPCLVAQRKGRRSRSACRLSRLALTLRPRCYIAPAPLGVLATASGPLYAATWRRRRSRDGSRPLPSLRLSTSQVALVSTPGAFGPCFRREDIRLPTAHSSHVRISSTRSYRLTKRKGWNAY